MGNPPVHSSRRLAARLLAVITLAVLAAGCAEVSEVRGDADADASNDAATDAIADPDPPPDLPPDATPSDTGADLQADTGADLQADSAADATDATDAEPDDAGADPDLAVPDDGGADLIDASDLSDASDPVDSSDASALDLADAAEATDAESDRPDAQDLFDAVADCPYDPADVTLVPHSTVFVGQTFDGASDQVTLTSPGCSPAADSPEAVYAFELAETTEVYIETRCGWDCALILTRGGCQVTDIAQCASTASEEVISTVLPPGSYFLFVETDGPAPAPFDLMVNRHRTSGQSPCQVDTVVDVMNPANCDDPAFESPQYVVDLTGETLAPADVDDSFVQGVGSCIWDEAHVGGGPDRIYEVTILDEPVGGTRSARFELDPDGWSSLLYLTGSPCGATSSLVECDDNTIASGTEVISTSLDPGTYYLIVDGFGEAVFDGEAWGAFDLSFQVFDNACAE